MYSRILLSGILTAVLCVTGCRNTTSYRPVCPTPVPAVVAAPPAPCCPTPGVIPPPPALPR